MKYPLDRWCKEKDFTIDTAYVYFIQVGDEAAVRIGSTIHSLDARLISLQSSNQRQLRLLGAIDVRVGFGADRPTRLELGQMAMRLERKIQRKFAAEHIHGAWFNLTDELREFIQTKSNVA